MPDTDTLTGRLLDAKVAEAMGWTDINPHCDIGASFGFGAGIPPGESLGYPIPPYSAADCSGLAPVLAWLVENGPEGINLELVFDGYGWRAGYWDADKLEWICVRDTDASTLPLAACRLLVAWAAKRKELT